MRNTIPLCLILLPLAASCSGGESDESFGPGVGGSGNVMITGGIGNTGNVPTGGVGNTGNVPTGGVGNVPTGGVGNTGNVPTGGVGNTGNVPTGGVGNTGNCTDVAPPNEGQTCETWAAWGQCGSDWFTTEGYCMESCGVCGGDNTGGVGNAENTGGVGNANTGGVGNANTGGVGNANTGGYGNSGADLPPLQNPKDGHATHYWDCCKPSCAWPDKGTAHSCSQSNGSISADAQSACAGGNSYQCWSMAPWAVGDNVAYGFAAINNVACGTCFQVEFTGTSSSRANDPGSAGLVGKKMIVQALNTGGIGEGQFDLLVPGGGVGDFNACTQQWGVSDLGERYGGYFLQCRNQNPGNHEAAKSCARSKCEQAFSGKQDLLDGCLWWVNWANLADNPNFKYDQVSCPAEISSTSGM